MTQTIAMLVDSLRHLRSRSLFWIVLIISCIAAITLFGTYSFNAEGVKVITVQFDNPSLAKGTAGSRSFISWMFNGVFVSMWLSWGAIILALISTASILPDFLQGGAIDTVVSKPISRLRLLLLKFLGSLAFVFVQVGVGVILAYLIIGLKFGMWLHSAMWAIPLITLQFVYLYAFSTFLAVLTRSTMASLLGTLLFWFFLFIVQMAANTMTEQVGALEFTHQSQTARITQMEAYMADLEREPSPIEVALLEQQQRNAEQTQASIDALAPWRDRLRLAALIVPKTGDVNKILANATQAPVDTEFAGLFTDVGEMIPGELTEEERQEMVDAGLSGERAKRRVDAAVSITSSLGFTSLLLLASGWLFRRRDL